MPLRRRRFVSAQAAIEAFAGAPPVDYSRLRTDLDSVAEHTEFSRAEGVSVGSVARPDELAEGKQLEVIVKIAINQLEPEFRRLVILRDVEDLSYEEIADVTGLPRGTVKSRIHRGRSQLRAKVERILGEKLGKGNK